MKRSTSARTAPDTGQFKTRLKSLNLKATPQRIAVHEAMLDLVHATAEMVCEHITTAGKTRISVASVYNILSAMADLGIYARRLNAGSKMWFDVNTFRHIHIYDRASDSFTDIFDDELAEAIEDRFRRKRFKGYKTERIDIQLICSPTRRKTKK